MNPTRARDLADTRTLEERDVEANQRDLVGRITILLVGERGGGDVGFVECAHVDGSGLSVTGLHGAVLNTSVRASYDALLHLGAQIGLSPDRLRAKRMSVHLVNMAQPKEGPSAGLAFALAMFSAATGRPIRRGLAVTGELSVHGHVGAIGGVLEKLDAAARHERTLAIIPSANAAELAQAPSIVQRMRIEPVATLEAAMVLAFDEPLRGLAVPPSPPSLADPISDEPPVGQRLLAILATELASDEVATLQAEVAAYASRISSVLPDRRATIAAALGGAIGALLELYPDLAPRHRALAVGAARYFLDEADEQHDLAEPTGLDDDVAVFNWVVRTIGRNDLVVHG
jgi:hypothetical protein